MTDFHPDEADDKVFPELFNTYSNPPERCEMCDAQIADVFYDVRTRDGRWGNLCRACFISEGCNGQKWTLRDDDKFRKAAG